MWGCCLLRQNSCRDVLKFSKLTHKSSQTFSSPQEHVSPSSTISLSFNKDQRPTRSLFVCSLTLFMPFCGTTRTTNLEMMITEGIHAYGGMQDILSSSPTSAAGGGEGGTLAAHGHALLYNLSVLKDKVQQLQALVSLVVSPDPLDRQSASVEITGAGSLIQEVIVAASSMMYTFQRAGLVPNNCDAADEFTSQTDSQVMDRIFHDLDVGGSRTDTFAADGNYINSCNSNDNTGRIGDASDREVRIRDNVTSKSTKELNPKRPTAAAAAATCDIIELNAADLLAKYTHYCQVCGKGFKRDANLRMHMRAHGDEYKTSAALSNPVKGDGGQQSDFGASTVPRKYSCPHEGCRWNKKHAKFQPLKSMVCVKNHYKRTHCPKMYVCNRCNRKQFSVLSDLRTHEKHCGELKWLCSCGTTFSRRDKLMGHVQLFVGHSPMMGSFPKHAEMEYHRLQMDLQKMQNGGRSSF